MTEDEVREALREVLDPEVGINVVDLGLVYGIEVHDRDVHVALTMTSAACPLGAHLQDQAVAAIGRRDPVARVTVDLVWHPPWSPERMSAEARRSLGW